jgi:outer membrane lipoprotein-sorting protein
MAYLAFTKSVPAKTISMKNVLFIICVAMGLTTMAQTAESFYKSKSGKLVYNFEADGVASEYTLWFDGYGKKQAMDFISMANGVKERVRTIVNETDVFIVNYTDKTVIKFPVMPDGNTITGMDSDGLNMAEMTKEIVSDKRSKTGTETVNGKACDVYKLSDGRSKGKFWIWNNFLMKADYIDEDGNHGFFEIKDIKTDISIAASEFQPPAGFQVTDMTETMKQMQMMQNMYGLPDEE